MRVLLGLAAFIILFGCIDIDYFQDVDRGGNSVITEKINLTALIQSDQNQTDFSSICINATQGRSDIYCTYEDGVVTVRKNFTAEDGHYSFEKSSEFPNIVYRLEIRRLPDLGGTDGLGQSEPSPDLRSAEARDGAATLRAVGLRMTYTIRMPGQIHYAEGGKIRDGTAEFDVLDFMEDQEYIVVESRELDIVPVAALALSAILAAVALALFVLKKK